MLEFRTNKTSINSSLICISDYLSWYLENLDNLEKAIIIDEDEIHRLKKQIHKAHDSIKELFDFFEEIKKLSDIEKDIEHILKDIRILEKFFDYIY